LRISSSLRKRTWVEMSGRVTPACRIRRSSARS
jgi:hypothetical protein